MKELDEVKLIEDIPYEEVKKHLWMERYYPKSGLKKGTEGVIVHVFVTPSTAYVVEFFDRTGKEIGHITVEPHQIELLKAF